MNSLYLSHTHTHYAHSVNMNKNIQAELHNIYITYNTYIKNSIVYLYFCKINFLYGCILRLTFHNNIVYNIIVHKFNLYINFIRLFLMNDILEDIQIADI